MDDKKSKNDVDSTNEDQIVPKRKLYPDNIYFPEDLPADWLRVRSLTNEDQIVPERKLYPDNIYFPQDLPADWLRVVHATDEKTIVTGCTDAQKMLDPTNVDSTLAESTVQRKKFYSDNIYFPQDLPLESLAIDATNKKIIVTESADAQKMLNPTNVDSTATESTVPKRKLYPDNIYFPQDLPADWPSVVDATDEKTMVTGCTDAQKMLDPTNVDSTPAESTVQRKKCYPDNIYFPQDLPPESPLAIDATNEKTIVTESADEQNMLNPTNVDSTATESTVRKRKLYPDNIYFPQDLPADWSSVVDATNEKIIVTESADAQKMLDSINVDFTQTESKVQRKKCYPDNIYFPQDLRTL